MARSPRKAVEGMQPLDPPSGVLDQVAAVTELLGQRTEELERTQHNLTLTRAQIQAERRRWEQELGEAQQALRIQQQHLEEEYRAKQAECEREHRRCQEATNRAQEYESETKQRLLSVVEREAKVAALNQERLEVATLRHELEVQRATNSDLYSQACLARDTASTKLEQARQLEAACEERNRLMNEEWNKLTAWQSSLTLRQKDNDLVLHEIDAKLTQLRSLDATHATAAAQPEEVVHEG